MLQDLKKMKKLYRDNVNIIDYLKDHLDSENNTSEMIRISYDLQAGSYIQNVLANPEWENEYSDVCKEFFDKLGVYDSILEAGIGEATELTNFLSKMSNVPSRIFGFDISYSRIQYAMYFLKKHNVTNSTLFMGDMFNAAIQDSSIDVVYTNHALEPNGGREREALSELYRITKKYLVLFEPDYDFASDETKAYIQKQRYVQHLYPTAVELGYKVIEHKLLFETHPNSINNTSVIIIEKDSLDNGVLNPLACPITKAPLELIRNNYYCKESLLLYPVVDQIPCLLSENAIIATHYPDDLKKILDVQ